MSPDLDGTGLETLRGLVARLSLFSKFIEVLISGREGRCDMPALVAGSAVAVGLTASSCRLE